MEAWERKAHRMIGDAARASHASMNAGRKRHRPYSLPEYARRLVALLGTEDRRAAEEEAKAIFFRASDLAEMGASPDEI